MTIEAHAVRVAAAAVALAEDAQRARRPQGGEQGEPRSGRRWWVPVEMVLGMVRDERARQAEKWGTRVRPPLEWLMILAAEAGVLADALAAAGPADGPAAVARLRLAEAGSAAADWLEANRHPEDPAPPSDQP